jgi:hypothetical protein
MQKIWVDVKEIWWHSGDPPPFPQVSGDWLKKGPGTGGEGPKDVFSLHGRRSHGPCSRYPQGFYTQPASRIGKFSTLHAALYIFCTKSRMECAGRCVNDFTAHGYDAFGLIGTTFRELESLTGKRESFSRERSR